MTELDLGTEPTSTEPVASVATAVETQPDVVETHSPESFEAKVAEADSILDALMGRITTVDNKSKYLKILVYGNPGTGKTVFTATAPSPLIIDVEKGAHSINNHPNLRNAKALEYKSLFQVEQLIKYLGADAPQLAEFKTIVVDSFSELQKRDLDAIVKEEAEKDANRNKFLPIGPDYNVNTEHMRMIASALRDLDRHIIVTCHVKEEKDETTGRILRRPNLTPKLAGTLAGIFDVVGYMATSGSGENTTRTLQVHPTADVTAKTRIGNLPAVIENPTFDAIYTAFTTHN
jgi:phage nucleotide-binding protein